MTLAVVNDDHDEDDFNFQGDMVQAKAIENFTAASENLSMLQDDPQNGECESRGKSKGRRNASGLECLALDVKDFDEAGRQGDEDDEVQGFANSTKKRLKLEEVIEIYDCIDVEGCVEYGDPQRRSGPSLNPSNDGLMNGQMEVACSREINLILPKQSSSCGSALEHPRCQVLPALVSEAIDIEDSTDDISQRSSPEPLLRRAKMRLLPFDQDRR